MKWSQVQQHKGFTLIETLVAVTILLLIIIGPMTIAQTGIKNAFFATQQVTATFLAQEAIEQVRALRDEEGMGVFWGGGGLADDWISAVQSECNGTYGCMYEASTDTFEECDTKDDCQLLISDGEYGHVSGDDSGFYRQVFIGNVTNGGLPVTAQVSWQSNAFGAERTVVLQTWIYNQYERYE